MHIDDIYIGVKLYIGGLELRVDLRIEGRSYAVRAI
jgi:hypothetical protein